MGNQKISFDVEYDLVVIGGGGSGKSAALTGAQGGLRVALLEKMAQTGGSSIYAEGLLHLNLVNKKNVKCLIMRENIFLHVRKLTVAISNTAIIVPIRTLSG